MMLIVTSHLVGKVFFNQTNNANQIEQNGSCNIIVVSEVLKGMRIGDC